MTTAKKPASAPRAPTAAEAWPMNPTITVHLPSGAVAKVRKPALYVLAKSGQVPKRVSTAANRLEAAPDVKHTPPAPDEDLDEYLTTFINDLETVVNFYCTRTFVEPRVTMTAQDGALWVGDLDGADKLAALAAVGIQP